MKNYCIIISCICSLFISSSSLAEEHNEVWTPNPTMVKVIPEKNLSCSMNLEVSSLGKTRSSCAFGKFRKKSNIYKFDVYIEFPLKNNVIYDWRVEHGLLIVFDKKSGEIISKVSLSILDR